MTDLERTVIWLEHPDGTRLATLHEAGEGPAVLFLHGLMSDMEGEKARALAQAAPESGWEFLRLDFSGHGRSDGAFADGSVSQWCGDARLALDRIAAARVILVGSSIGGWVALLLALACPDRVAGLVLIAPAPDATRRITESLSPEAQAALLRDGVWLRPSRYGAPIPISRRMLEDGEQLCLLDGPIALDCPVRILHGQCDEDVPWRGSLLLAERLCSDDVRVILLKQGDHRLSQPEELALLTSTVNELRNQLATQRMDSQGEP